MKNFLFGRTRYRYYVMRIVYLFSTSDFLKNNIISVSYTHLDVYKRQAFDNKNNVTLTKDPTGAQTLYVYDAAGRLAESHDALGNATRYRLNGRGLPVEIIDALGQKYTKEYDAAGKRLCHKAVHPGRRPLRHIAQRVGFRSAEARIDVYKRQELFSPET